MCSIHNLTFWLRFFPVHVLSGQYTQSNMGYLFSSAHLRGSKKAASGKEWDLFLQWFMEPITKHKLVYGWYMQRLHFVYRLLITTNLPLFNFMSQLTDDTNVIFCLQPLCLASLWHFIHLSYPFFPLATTVTAAVDTDDQGGKRKSLLLWSRRGAAHGFPQVADRRSYKESSPRVQRAICSGVK